MKLHGIYANMYETQQSWYSEDSNAEPEQIAVDWNKIERAE